MSSERAVEPSNHTTRGGLLKQPDKHDVTNNGGITITRYNALGGSPSIPSTIDGLPVTTIGDLAFSRCTNLTGVQIPDTVAVIGFAAFHNQRLTGLALPANLLSIGDQAFENCLRLTELSIPHNVTNIGSYAFAYCLGLTNLTLGSGVLRIGSSAFAHCVKFPRVELPAGVTSIEESAFYDCISLQEFTVPSVNAFYSSPDGVLFNKTRTTLLLCPARKSGTYSIPATVGVVGSYAFSSCSNLSAIIFPEGVSTIGRGAFEVCRGLTNVSIPDSVSRLESEAFYRCSNLIEVKLPKRLTAVPDATFMSCANLASIRIPEDVSRIGRLAFYQCSSLTNVTLPCSLAVVEEGAFSYCTSLTRMMIPDSVRHLGTSAFESSALREAFFQGDAPNLDPKVFPYLNHPTVYYLPGTAGWEPTYGFVPTAPWQLPYPIILTTGSLRVQNSQFSFTISWATNRSVVVEASTTLPDPIWFPVATNVLVNGSSQFSDSDFTTNRTKAYRIRAL